MSTSIVFQHPPMINKCINKYNDECDNDECDNDEIGLLEIIEITIETMTHIREEVLDRLFSILRMINKYNQSPIQAMEHDYNSLFEELKINFTFSKAFDIINMMLDDKVMETFPYIYKFISLYDYEIKNIIVNANMEYCINKYEKTRHYETTNKEIINEINKVEYFNSKNVQSENCNETIV